MQNNDLKRIEIDIKEAEKNIERMEALNRLRANKDFKALIEEGYLGDEASRVVLAKAEPGLQNEDSQKYLDNMIIAIGYFRQYLNKIYQFGNQSKHAIEGQRQTREDIMAEAQ